MEVKESKHVYTSGKVGWLAYMDIERTWESIRDKKKISANKNLNNTSALDRMNDSNCQNWHKFKNPKGKRHLKTQKKKF
jgi:hypothetical protein